MFHHFFAIKNKRTPAYIIKDREKTKQNKTEAKTKTKPVSKPPPDDFIPSTEVGSTSGVLPSMPRLLSWHLIITLGHWLRACA